jgi:hypothetical protein
MDSRTVVLQKYGIGILWYCHDILKWWYSNTVLPNMPLTLTDRLCVLAKSNHSNVYRLHVDAPRQGARARWRSSDPRETKIHSVGRSAALVWLVGRESLLDVDPKNPRTVRGDGSRATRSSTSQGSVVLATTQRVLASYRSQHYFAGRTSPSRCYLINCTARTAPTILWPHAHVGDRRYGSAPGRKQEDSATLAPSRFEKRATGIYLYGCRGRTRADEVDAGGGMYTLRRHRRTEDVSYAA